jgi:ketosteroid isomerase-like protein
MNQREDHMSEQDNVRIARQLWDAWNAHDVDGMLKHLDEKHVWERIRCLRPLLP